MGRRFFARRSPVPSLPVDGMTGRRAVHPFPPDIPVVGQGAIGEDRVFFHGRHRGRIRFTGGAGGDSEESAFGIDGIRPAVGTDLDPGDVVADTLAFPAGDGGRQHCQVGLPAGRGKGGGEMVRFPGGARQTQDQHMLGHPALAICHGGSDAQGQALFSQQGIASISAPIGPDEVLFGKVADVLLLQGSAGPGAIFLSRTERRADRVQAGNEFAVGAEFLDHFCSDAGHDVHVADHVRAVGDLDADLGDGGIDRAHGKGNHIKGATPHASLVEPPHRRP